MLPVRVGQLGEGLAQALAPLGMDVVEVGVGLDEAAKCALISMDSTIRSNLSVGLPLDLLIYERDALKIGHHHVIDQDNAYFNHIHSQWGQSLRQAFAELPDPDWKHFK